MSILLDFAKRQQSAMVIASKISFPNSVQLLASLRDGLMAESDHLCFDYFSMYRTCYNLLPKLRDCAQSEFAAVSAESLGDALSNNLATLQKIIPTLLGATFGDYRVALGQLVMKVSGRRLLLKVGIAVQQTVETDGEKEVTNIARFKKGLGALVFPTSQILDLTTIDRALAAAIPTVEPPVGKAFSSKTRSVLNEVAALLNNVKQLKGEAAMRAAKISGSDEVMSSEAISHKKRNNANKNKNRKMKKKVEDKCEQEPASTAEEGL
ncbi:hypothetical protein EJ08DRAFT_693022 [Tothia fuscella]|uniref:Uncharacterized protein n=1 Tax=Tothia fuscella TaxID=1048955 RepID=A0A9P4P1W8_9PEZI|nr:hypothetical protein EJ08DRAFT_693022 [Tothia fuscella]